MEEIEAEGSEILLPDRLEKLRTTTVLGCYAANWRYVPDALYRYIFSFTIFSFNIAVNTLYLSPFLYEAMWKVFWIVIGYGDFREREHVRRNSSLELIGSKRMDFNGHIFICRPVSDIPDKFTE